MEVLTKLGGGAKIVLKVKFRGRFSVSIDLVSIKKDYVKKSNRNNYMYFRHEYSDFVLWSTQDFIFDDRQIRLPDEKHITKHMTHTHVFPSDAARYATLKKMYSTLENWSKVDDMKKGVFAGKKCRVILKGNYWYIS